MEVILFIIATIMAIYAYNLLHQLFDIRYFSFTAMFMRFAGIWLAIYILLTYIFDFLFGWLI